MAFEYSFSKFEDAQDPNWLSWIGVENSNEYTCWMKTNLFSLKASLLNRMAASIYQMKQGQILPTFWRSNLRTHKYSMNSTSIEAASVEKSKVPLYISISIVVILVRSYFLIPGVQDFLNESWDVLTSNDNQRIRNWADCFGWFGPLLLVLCMVAQMFLLVIPSIALMVVSILAYGPVWGSLIVLASIFTASSIGYWIGHYFGPVIVEKLIGHKSEKKIANFLEDYGFWAVIVTR